MTQADPILAVEKLSVRFTTYDGVVDAVRVERPDALRDALESALRSPLPSLLEIVVA